MIREKRLAGGPASFPIDQTIKQIDAKYEWRRYECEFAQEAALQYNDHCIPSALDAILEFCVSHLKKARKLAACEKVLWDRPLTDTVHRIAFFEQKIQREIDDAAEVLAAFFFRHLESSA